MLKNIGTLLYKLDLIGITPHLLIFNNNRYKSTFSLITSINILFFSIIFAIYSIIQYLKFDSPIIVYSKGNDEKTKREFFLKDTLFMFQLVDSSSMGSLSNSTAFFQAENIIVYDNGTIKNNEVNIEMCELGKNIDMKYKDLIRDKTKFHKSLDEFYCFSSNNGDISLFYYPNIGISSINIDIFLKNNSYYIPEKLQTLIVSENDLIEHNNKSSPINKNYIYYLTAGYSSSEFTLVNYNFRYIKYETDDGLFFKNSKIIDGASFSDMTFYKTLKDDYNFKKDIESYNYSNIARITFDINRVYYDNYKRSYPKLQSLLAEVMSVVNLLFEIGRQLSNILCAKRMSKDIIENLLNKNSKYIMSQQNNNSHKYFKNLDKSQITISERKKTKQESENKTINKDYLDQNNISKLNSSKNRNLHIRKINKANFIHNVFIKINYFQILKSFLCFKDPKTKLINYSHKIITEDLSVERILKRLYHLEDIGRLYSNEEEDKLNHMKNDRFNKINKYIYKIIYNTKK